MRGAIAAEIQDETALFLSSAELGKLAKALENSTSRIHPAEITEEFGSLPAGSRAVVANLSIKILVPVRQSRNPDLGDARRGAAGSSRRVSLKPNMPSEGPAKENSKIANGGSR